MFGAVTEKIELRGFASTPMRIAQIIAIGSLLLDWNTGLMEYWNDGLRRIKGKNPYFQLLIPTIPIIQHSNIPW
jgi:hypothetical protein